MQEVTTSSPFRRRPPPRLRTKTGCFKCRERRKKCDESRPICSACSRNGFACIWPSTKSPSSQPNHKIPDTRADPSPDPSSPTPSSLECIWDDWGVNTLQAPKARTLFDYFRSALQPLMFRSHVHPIYLTSDWFVHGALQHSSLMHALLAVSAVHLSCLYPAYRLTGIEYYSQAVSATREQLEKKLLKGTEDWLIMVLVLAYLVEIWFFDDIPSIKKHLEAASHLLHSRQLSFKKQDLIPDPSFERLIAESILCNTSAISMLMHESCDVSSDVVSKHLELFPGEKSMESPLLGVSPELYFLVVEVSRLCFQESVEMEEAKGLESRFFEWREGSMGDIDSEENELDTNFMLGVRLYVLSIELLLARLLGNREQSEILDLVAEAAGVIGEMGSYIECALNMDYYTWPLLIIGAAGKGQESCETVVRERMENIKKKSGCGGVKLVSSLLERVWDFDAIEPEEDGLGILLRIGREEIAQL
ncbi:uncharacterized protein LY89DRAFT_784191 [Mollisia scopiformis]|uniref:Zn(2)-C6 fungal-type domain-containing protein n=1 Tax=Mollisia scopiformis TaxID=149040 RepID=A0A194X1Y9_MOLSC|nr:uncharacterized protein LY89DRAFT_784191 [Mollisia scopiformis]KUJ14201.1 hypothetical protein LY89DRAFT_784191 [Mollisia scopiformis]